MLFTGRGPFKSVNNDVLELNTIGVVKYPQRFWQCISAEGRDLVENMLQIDQKNRLSAVQALDHPWFGQLGICDSLDDVLEELEDEEVEAQVAPKNNNLNVIANPLLTVTPIMGGRKFVTDCESPFLASGLGKYIMEPKTPNLRDGFDRTPRNVMSPGYNQYSKVSR